MGNARARGKLSAVVRATPQAKKLVQLRQREAERKARIQAEVSGWFRDFDKNNDGKLQREELRALLAWMHPSRPPTDENLDYLIERATAVESSSLRLPGGGGGSAVRGRGRANGARHQDTFWTAGPDGSSYRKRLGSDMANADFLD